MHWRWCICPLPSQRIKVTSTRHMIRKSFATLLLLAALLAAQADLSLGQSTRSIRVQRGSTDVVRNADANVDALQLRIPFVLQDERNAVIAADVERAQLLVDGKDSLGKVEKIAGEWTVQLLVDTSNGLSAPTAANDFALLKQSLGQTLERTEAKALYSLLTFDDGTRVQPDIDRVNDLDVLRKALADPNRIKPVTGAKACLNLGLRDAIFRMQNATKRRAVIVVTGSKDNCGNVPLADVLNIAQQTNTNIFIAVLEGYGATAADMRQYTDPTGGIAIQRGSGDLLFGLAGMMPALGLQSEAVFELFPSQGDKKAELVLFLKDQRQARAPVSFPVARNFAGPTVLRLGSAIQSVTDGLLFTLNIENEARMNQLEVIIRQKASQQEIYKQLIDKANIKRDLTITPRPALAKDVDYQLEIIARDEQRNQVARVAPSDFKFQPQQVALSAQFSKPSVENEAFLITASVSSMAGVDRMEAFLLNSQDAQVAGTVDKQVPGRILRIPATNLAEGNYKLRVRALDADGRVIAELPAGKDTELTYTAPSMPDRLAFGIGQSPGLFAGLLGVVLAAVIGLSGLVWYTKRHALRAAKVVDIGVERKERERPAMAQIPSFETMSGAKPASVAAAGAGGQLRRATFKVREPAGVSSFSATQSPCSIGRAPDNAWVVPQGEALGISRKHLTLRFANGSWQAEDEGSANGSFLNGKKLSKGAPVALKEGDVLRLGIKLEVQLKLEN